MWVSKTLESGAIFMHVKRQNQPKTYENTTKLKGDNFGTQNPGLEFNNNKD